MSKFGSLSMFYWYFKGNGNFTINDVNELEEQLRSAGYYVKENKNETIVVKTPEELESSKKRRLALQRSESAKYTKLGAAMPIPKVKAFADACRKLGITQSEALIPAIDAIIEKASHSSSQQH